MASPIINAFTTRPSRFNAPASFLSDMQVFLSEMSDHRGDINLSVNFLNSILINANDYGFISDPIGEVLEPIVFGRIPVPTLKQGGQDTVSEIEAANFFLIDNVAELQAKLNDIDAVNDTNGQPLNFQVDSLGDITPQVGDPASLFNGRYDWFLTAYNAYLGQLEELGDNINLLFAPESYDSVSEQANEFDDFGVL